MKLTLTCLVLFLLVACNTNKTVVESTDSIASRLLANTVDAHGGNAYETAKYEFVFREKVYTFDNNGSQYKYSVLSRKEGKEVVGVMSNGYFIRKVNGTEVELSEKEKKGYGAGLNSVIYFATLPHKLLDPSVNLNYMGTTEIADSNYEILKVTFDEVGGGQDFDDQYYYWINQESYLIDYFAYNYSVSGGGVRFRSAYNTRTVAGIVFQDYINYKAPVGTALEDLPRLYLRGELKELSVIATEDVRQLN